MIDIKPAMLSFLIVVCALMSGCGATIEAQRFYAPPPRRAAEVARMWNNQHMLVKVVRVDGRPVEISVWKAGVIEVLPGNHLVTVKSNTGDEMTIPWVAEAGKEYEPEVFSTAQEHAVQRAGGGFGQGTPNIVPATFKRSFVKIQ